MLKMGFICLIFREKAIKKKKKKKAIDFIIIKKNMRKNKNKIQIKINKFRTF